MSKIKIIHEPKICIGCYACANTEPDYWEMKEDKDGDIKSHIKGSKDVDDTEVLEVDEMANNMEAAEVCPVNCIHIEVDGERKI